MRRTLALFGGAGIGTLLGLLLGLSVSNTVGVVVGALSSVLIVLLGLKDTTDADLQALRSGAFGFACAAALLTGVYLRAHNALAPDIRSEVAKWTAGNVFSPQEAKQFVAFERLAIVPPSATLDTARRSHEGAQHTVLYAATVRTSDCAELKNYQAYSREEKLQAYQQLGGVWKDFADQTARQVPAAQQSTVLSLAYRCLCHD